ncbi:MAG TPA: molybdopterin-dependent oxidoreductase [Candidatus Bathyarchaeia archaeon]
MSPATEKKKDLPPGQKAIKRILSWGIDHPGITSANPMIDIGRYMLTIDGEVNNPVRLTWAEVMDLPRTVSLSDFHCVEGWSVLDCKWEGVRFGDIERLVKPKNTAKAVTFECADNYTTSLFLTELEETDVLLAYSLNGKPLEEGLGFPLRLIVPTKYAYKSALWVNSLHFTRNKDLGFWERRGYSDSADVWKNDRFRK